MVKIRKKTFLFGGFILLALIVLPITIFFFQQRQITNSNAEKTVVLSYGPDTSSESAAISVSPGSAVPLDVYVDPGTNSVSFIKLIMNYDPTKFALVGTGFTPVQEFTHNPTLALSTQAPLQVIAGPVTTTSGQVAITLSVGANPTAVIAAKTNIWTLELKAFSTDPASSSTVNFGSQSTVLSVSSGTNFNENVIANTLLATIQITNSKISCGIAPSDAMLLMDTSDSMLAKAGSSGTKLSNAKIAAELFYSHISAMAFAAIQVDRDQEEKYHHGAAMLETSRHLGIIHTLLQEG